MSNSINPNIGSGIQGHRKLHAGQWNGITQTVAVMNFEDSVAVESFYNSVIEIPTANAVRVPSGQNLVRRRTLVLNNQGGAPVYIGSSGVTLANGYPIDVGGEKGFEIGALIDVWAIASGTSSELRVLELA